MNPLDTAKISRTGLRVIRLGLGGGPCSGLYSDVAINTVVKLLTELGSACLDYQDTNMRNLSCKRIQCDEIWSFVYS